MTIAVALCLTSTALAANPPTGSSTASPSDSRAQVESQVQSDIQQRKREAEQQASKSIDQDAVAAIGAAEKALAAIDAGNHDEALAAMEQAAGKTELLVGRKPASGLVPVRAEVEVIDLAPGDVKDIEKVANAAEKAVDHKDYPAARALLEGLVSELRVTTVHIPLVTYPVAMKEAARLLDAKKDKEAAAVLLTALNTLAVIHRVEPLPVAYAEQAIVQAQAAQKDKDKAQQLLAAAKTELERAKALGYAGKDPEYTALNNQIAELEKQLQGNTDTASAFTKLKEKISSFFKRQSDSEKKSQVAMR
jgi:hypothetical protein